MKPEFYFKYYVVGCSKYFAVLFTVRSRDRDLARDWTILGSNPGRNKGYCGAPNLVFNGYLYRR